MLSSTYLLAFILVLDIARLSIWNKNKPINIILLLIELINHFMLTTTLDTHFVLARH
jgi:hypothetical protein